jgi:hypothetical protein
VRCGIVIVLGGPQQRALCVGAQAVIEQAPGMSTIPGVPLSGGVRVLIAAKPGPECAGTAY